MLIKLKGFFKCHFFLIITLMVCALYAGILFNQTLPFAEGWYTYYAKLINSGQVPYRDFDYLYTPIYIYFIAFFTRIFGYDIIALRALGVLMFCLISFLLYLCVIEIVGKENSWIACVAAVSGSFYMQSEVVQIFYDYVRFMDIFSILTALLLLKTVNRMMHEKSYFPMLIMTGVSTAILLNIKQNYGLILGAYIIVLLIYLGLYFKIKPKKLLQNVFSYVLPIVIFTALVYLILFLSGCLSNYMELTGSSALSAKGGWFSILFGWIPTNWNSFISASKMACVILLVMAFGIICSKMGNKDSVEENSNKVNKGWILGVIYGLSVSVIILVIKDSEKLANSIYSGQIITPYTIFLVVFTMFVVMGVYGLYCIITRKRDLDSSLLIFVWGGIYFALAYSCGNSGGLAEGQSTTGVVFIVIVLLMLLRYKWEQLFRTAIVLICICFTVKAADKKMIYTYNWWGMDESSFWDSTETTDLPLLSGIGLSSETKEVYEGIYEIVMNNTTEEDTIFCFPQIPIFYSITGRSDPGTRSKVQWFDVSDDDTLLEDIEVIRSNPPKVIIMYNTSEYAYQSHESAFRNGEMSGTRMMREFLYNFVYENAYRLEGRFVANSNVIQVWVLDEVSQADCISVFSGGSGTAEDPYLIETSEQLVLLAQMVNDGRTFEGIYIKQIADIDLSEVDNWIPIGQYEGDVAFMGTYDGGGHVISNLHSYSTDENYNLGLFGKLGGTVCNLGLEGGSISGSCCGGIASHSYGSNARIINCYTAIDMYGYRVGGIADNFSGTIVNCFSVGNLTAIESADLVSYNSHGGCKISSSYILSGSYQSGLYIETEHSNDIIICEQDYINSGLVVSLLNSVVSQMNETSVNGDIVLTNWCVGESHPVFDIEP